MDKDKLLTEREAAKYLGIELRTLAAWRQRGDGPVAVILGPKTVRYRSADIIAFVDSRIKPQDGED